MSGGSGYIWYMVYEWRQWVYMGYMVYEWRQWVYMVFGIYGVYGICWNYCIKNGINLLLKLKV